VKTLLEELSIKLYLSVKHYIDVIMEMSDIRKESEFSGDISVFVSIMLGLLFLESMIVFRFSETSQTVKPLH
jgi:hypothetical protein